MKACIIYASRATKRRFVNQYRKVIYKLQSLPKLQQLTLVVKIKKQIGIIKKVVFTKNKLLKVQ